MKIKKPILPQLSKDDNRYSSHKNNIEIIADIPMKITVEVGTAIMSLNNILNLTSGSIIGLKEEITEPVKIYANGSFIATGEIVVIDQNFAVRVKSINKN